MFTIHRSLVRIGLATALCTLGIQAFADESPKLKAQTNSSSMEKSDEPDLKKLSEAFGHFIGRNLKTSGLNFDMDSFVKGIRDGESGKPAPMSDKDYEEQMIVLQEKAFKHLANDNLKAAEGFLDKNSKETGVQQIIPGKLQFIILQEGKGQAVTEHSHPKIQYTGKYLDGTVFGSSEDTGGPITIPLDQTIPGFSQGLVGMKEGEKRRLFVHPDLGYGKTGHLPPNSLLIFDVEVQEANSSDHSALDSDEDEDLAEIYSSESSDDLAAMSEDDENEYEEENPSKNS